MLVSHVAICINALRNINIPLRQSANIFATAMVWFQRISTRTLAFKKKCKNKFDCLIFEMFFIDELKTTVNVPCDLIRAKASYCSFIICFLHFYEAFQGVKATSDTALKTGDMGLSKHRQATQLNRQNTTVTQ